MLGISTGSTVWSDTTCLPFCILYWMPPYIPSPSSSMTRDCLSVPAGTIRHHVSLNKYAPICAKCKYLLEGSTRSALLFLLLRWMRRPSHVMHLNLFLSLGCDGFCHERPRLHIIRRRAINARHNHLSHLHHRLRLPSRPTAAPSHSQSCSLPRT